MSFIKSEIVTVNNSQVELNYHSQTMGVWSDGTHCGIFKADANGWTAYGYNYGWTANHSTVEDALEEVLLNIKTPNQDLYDYDGYLDDHDGMYDVYDQTDNDYDDYDNSGRF